MTWLITYHAEEISREGFRGFGMPNKYIAMEYTQKHPFKWLEEKQAFYRQCFQVEPQGNTIIIAVRVVGIISAIEGQPLTANTASESQTPGPGSISPAR